MVAQYRYQVDYSIFYVLYKTLHWKWWTNLLPDMTILTFTDGKKMPVLFHSPLEFVSVTIMIFTGEKEMPLLVFRRMFLINFLSHYFTVLIVIVSFCNFKFVTGYLKYCV